MQGLTISCSPLRFVAVPLCKRVMEVKVITSVLIRILNLDRVFACISALVDVYFVKYLDTPKLFYLLLGAINFE